VPSAWIPVTVDALSAIGTVGAFAIGFMLLRKEHRREEARAEEGRRLQAIKVSAWVEAHATAHGGRELLFHVHNASEMPIYEVSLPMPDDGAHEAEFIGLVPPGQTVQRRAPREWLKTYYAPEPVEIEFLDSSGCQWTRDEQGFLTPAADADHSAVVLAPSSKWLRLLGGRWRSRPSAGTGSGWRARWRGARRRRGHTGSGSP
jgi:hypothetical protein